MGWVWRNDESDEFKNSPAGEFTTSESPNLSSCGDRCSTRKVVRSNCKTEEIETGKFVRKCEKTEEFLRDCVGRTMEVLKSNKEYTEGDITDQVAKGSQVMEPFDAPFNFPGLRSDIEAIEHELFGALENELLGSIIRFLDFFRHAGQSPYPPAMRRGVPLKSSKPKRPDPGFADLSGLVREV